MATLLFTLAAAIAAVAFVVHTFIGGARVARPILADQTLPLPSKWLNYMCWHIATLFLVYASLRAALLAAGIGSELDAWLTGILALSAGVWSFVVERRAGVAILRFPSTSLLTLTGLVLCLGAWLR